MISVSLQMSMCPVSKKKCGAMRLKRELKAGTMLEMAWVLMQVTASTLIQGGRVPVTIMMMRTSILIPVFVKDLGELEHHHLMMLSSALPLSIVRYFRNNMIHVLLRINGSLMTKPRPAGNLHTKVNIVSLVLTSIKGLLTPKSLPLMDMPLKVHVLSKVKVISKIGCHHTLIKIFLWIKTRFHVQGKTHRAPEQNSITLGRIGTWVRLLCPSSLRDIHSDLLLMDIQLVLRNKV